MANAITNPFKSLTRNSWKKWHSALLAAVICIFAATPAAAQQNVFTVNSTGDGSDFSAGDGVCEVSSGGGLQQHQQRVPGGVARR